MIPLISFPLRLVMVSQYNNALIVADKTSGAERRHFKRAPYDSRLRELAKLPNGQRTKGIGKDLSAGGMRVLCNEYLTQGQFLKLQFTLPWDLGSVDCEGQVQWITKGGSDHLIGIKFLNLGAVHTKRIEQYVEEAATRGKEPIMVKILSIFKS